MVHQTRAPDPSQTIAQPIVYNRMLEEKSRKVNGKKAKGKNEQSREAIMRIMWARFRLGVPAGEELALRARLQKDLDVCGKEHCASWCCAAPALPDMCACNGRRA